MPITSWWLFIQFEKHKRNISRPPVVRCRRIEQKFRTHPDRPGLVIHQELAPAVNDIPVVGTRALRRFCHTVYTHVRMNGVARFC